MTATARILADHVRHSAREVILQPDLAALAALAARLGLPAIHRLTCRFALSRKGDGPILAAGRLEADISLEDVTTAEAFTASIADDFTLRLVPEETLSDQIDPDDPVDEVGYAGGIIDLTEIMAEQLALAVPAYPRRE